MERVPSVSHDCTLYSIVMTDTGDDMILFLTFQNFQRRFCNALPWLRLRFFSRNNLKRERIKREHGEGTGVYSCYNARENRN